MNPYVYKKLDRAKHEIRLLTLHPSHGLKSPIHVSLSHVPFHPQHHIPRPEIDEEAIERGLPEDWFAHETIEGNVLYSYYVKNVAKTTWNHPKSGSIIVPSTPNDCPSFDPAFEALSYT